VTQTVSMAPVLGGRVIRMEPRVKGMTYKPIGSNSTVTKLLEEHEPEAAERAAKSRRLVEAFGSQRRLRQMRAGQAGRVEAQHVSGGNAVMGIVANAAAASPLGKAELIAAVLSDKNIPPHNPSATSAEEAYKYDQIVPGSLRESLETALLAPAIDKQEYRRELVDNDTFGGYVPDRTPQLAACNHVIERDQRLRMLILLGHMLKLYTKFGSLRSRNGYKELAEKTKMGESVIEGLVELFYTRGDEEGRWVLTKDKRSLMLSWMLVLAVRAEQNSVLDGAAFSALATQLKMRNGELMGRYKELGCMAASSKVANEEGKMVQSYKIALLPPGSGSEERRTLAESFPALKLGARKR
jgi:DNA-directed RNA polymerase I subunit RPA49